MQITHLKAAEVFSIRAIKTWIHCAAGQIWLSHDGRDVILECGQKWQIEGTDPVVIQALQNSRFIFAKNAHLSQSEQSAVFSMNQPRHLIGS
ncbi:DUF2917 domain-containing protein [Iodobacter arcticus]|uniref:DUF2917 domain-containing protein n=1 Tax=Iodobacter arcticus TaxID=590593 RepID=A0ABW2R0V2_9NEIS